MKRVGRQATIGSGMNGLIGRLSKKSPGAAASARAGVAWTRIAGDLVKRHTTGAHLQDGTLIVYVDGPIWATELSAMSEHYRVALNEELGEEMVSAVRFAVSRKVAAEQRIVQEADETDAFYHQDHVQPVPLTETELAQVVASVEGIEDISLREAVLRASVKDLEWKKGISARNSRQKPREGA